MMNRLDELNTLIANILSEAWGIVLDLFPYGYFMLIIVFYAILLVAIVESIAQAVPQ